MAARANNLSSVAPENAAGVSSWTTESDVVVVGAGCAGLCAAIEARGLGADVLVLDRAGAPGGASALSGGSLYLGGGTAVQKACGFDDTPEEMYNFLVAAVGPAPDVDKIAAYARGSVEHFDWLVAQGVPFNASFWPEPAWLPPTDDGLMWMGENSHPFCEIARPAPRGHLPQASGRSGGVLMDVLARAAAHAGVRVDVDTALVRLIASDDGTVVGVSARRYGEEILVRARRGVVLAAGGFVADDDMVADHAPTLLGHTKLGTDYDDGRAIRAAQAVGARTRRMAAGEASINLSPALLARSVLVNQQGQRFINEDTYPGRVGQMTLFHHGGRAYLVFDETAHEEVPDHLRHGRAPQWVCGSLEELEAEIELPSGSLQATVELYNHHARTEADPVFFKKSRWVRPLEAPFGAMDVRAPRADGPVDPADKATGFRVFTLGGLCTTTDGAVLNVDGEAIPGLFAAGRTTSGIHGWGYISGTSLGDGTLFGRRAGRAAVA